MNVRLLEPLMPEQKIQSIKALRAATFMGLKEAKDLFESMVPIGSTVHNGIILQVEIVNDIPDAIYDLKKYFRFENVKNLKLYEVRTSSRVVLILSTCKDEAAVHVARLTDQLVSKAKEITGPFKNGTVLCQYEDLPF